MADIKESIGTRLARHLRHRTLTGLALVLPIAITIFFLRIIFIAVSGFLAPILKRFLGTATPIPPAAVSALSIVILLLALYLAGVIAMHVFGRRLIGFGEWLLLRIPLVKAIYGPAKKVVELLSLGDKSAFKSVVIVEFPRAGCRALAFATGIVLDADGRRFYKIFVPTAPNPTSGFLVIFPEDQVRSIDMSVEDAVTMIVSGGLISPGRINETNRPPET